MALKRVASNELFDVEAKQLAKDLKATELDSDSDADDANPPHPGQQNSAERRRAQNEIFRAFINQKAEKLTKEEIQQAIRAKDDEEISTRSLLAKQESNAVITDPREYQIELYEKAKKDNIIAVLDTGSGKTLIAVLLLRYVIDQELEDRMRGEPPRLSFFIVDSVTLVFQQFTVLEANLDHKIEHFYGAMGASLWDKKHWKTNIAENMVIVCTAEVLHQALMHSFVMMEQINLLIFDEAHHAKKSHPYAMIIHDFYLSQNEGAKRPKIFGMTASPVDARVDVAQAAKLDLESLLHCRIATTSDLAQLSRVIAHPVEHVVQYDSLPPRFETGLHQRIKSLCGDIPALNRLINRALDISSELGCWSADLYWSLALTKEEVSKKEQKIGHLFETRGAGQSMSHMNDQVARLHEAARIVKEQSFRSPAVDQSDLSSKVRELHSLLVGYFERPSETRCIVFVERRHTARLLKQIFDHIGTPYLHTGILVGQTDRGGAENLSVRQQVMAVSKFRRGELNCLFATSIAEEGLDIPDCNVVVRFDLYRTMIQYIQSRGRARHRNSKYYHMIEKGNQMQIQKVMEARQAETVMRTFCNSLPEDRKLRGNDFDLDDMLTSGKGFRTYTEAKTGAKLTYGSSLGVLAHFVAAIPRESNMDPPTPQYIMSSERGKFVAEVILPEGSPITCATGRHCSRKSIAKRSAAFEACILLRKGQYLDEYLLPIYTKHLPAMRNALLALDLKKTNLYTMRLKPSVWENTRGSEPEELFLTVLDLSEQMERPHQPLGFLTRTPMPQFPRFPLYLNAGDVTWVISLPVQSPLTVRSDTITQFTAFTLRIFKDIFNKTYENDPENMSYWLVPVLPAEGVSETSQPSGLIDWEVLHTVFENDEYKWSKEMPASFLEDKFLVDRWDGGRRFFSMGIHPTYKPTDPVPEHAVKGKYMKNILEYSISLYKNSRAKLADQWDRSQPVVVTEKILHRRNMLAEADSKERALRSTAYLCPEPLRISALPTRVASMCLVFPAIIHRIDSYLTALETCDLIGIKVDADLALEAVTKDSDNSEEHSETKVNFKHGMGSNYERLEFLGDCFLKMATSISLFGQNPNNDEFEFHVKRMLLICNQNLYNVAVTLKLYEYIRSQSFSRRTWYPEGVKLLEGKGHKKTGEEVIKHSLGDKTIADVCEALIGAAYLEHNDRQAWRPENWDDAVKAVTKLVCSEDHAMLKWADYHAAYEVPAYQTAAATASQLDLVTKVELEHAYRFRWPRLLRSAFCHPSYPFMYERVPSYQRLEFLGDALLDMASVSHLFYRFPERDPQWLTEHKMAMVSNKFLGAVCVRLGFHRHLRYIHSQIERQIRDYVTDLEEAEREANGARDYWTTVKSPPKCLPDVVESYVGALFVDSDFNYAEVQRFFDEHIRWFFEDMSIYDTFANNHPTTRLQHVLTTHFGCHDYRIFAGELPTLSSTVVSDAIPRILGGVVVHNSVIGEGTASSGKNAKVKASANALQRLNGMAPFEFRAQFGCACVAETGVEGDEENSPEVGSAV